MIRIVAITTFIIIANIALFVVKPWSDGGDTSDPVTVTRTDIDPLRGQAAPELATAGRPIRLEDARAAALKLGAGTATPAPATPQPVDVATADPMLELTASIVAGLSAADTDAPVLTQITSVAAEDNIYVVQPGDSLTTIAKSHYGDPMDFRKIYEANRAVIGAAPVVTPGMRLHLP